MVELFEAQARVRAIRYGGDRIYEPPSFRDGLLAWSQFRDSGVSVTDELLPHVARALGRICDRLGLPPSSVRTLVFPSADMQAHCLTVTESLCAVRLSSSLIERLTAEELEFVIGHEIGHFLLGFLPPQVDAWTIESAQASRARELSCDRVGLIACDDIQLAIRAIMKVAIGLDERHLRLDASAYIRTGLDEYSATVDPSRAISSHPPMAIRARSLIWFDEFRREHYPKMNQRAKELFLKLDRRVNKDMLKYVEREAMDVLASGIHELASWIWVSAVVSRGSFDRNAQNILAEKFGSHFCNSVRSRLHDANKSEVITWVEANVENSILQFKGTFPSKLAAIWHDEIIESERYLLGGEEKNFIRSLSLLNVRGGILQQA